MTLDRDTYRTLIDARVHEPRTLIDALRDRQHRSPISDDGNLVIIAADHTARGKLALGDDPLAMSDRYTLLDRLVRCLAMPGVDGVLASADILEDLAWLGALDNRLAIGTMNRGGIIGATWELDDRLSAYDADHIESLGLDGGKTLLRIDPVDAAVPRTIEMVAELTTQLADRQLLAMIEPLPYVTTPAGRVELDTSEESLIRTVAIASGLGSLSAYTWLKVPPSSRMSEVAGATSLPILMLGGEPSSDTNSVFDRWADAMVEPNVRGVVAGRTLLYPSDGDPEGATQRAAALVHSTAHATKEAP